MSTTDSKADLFAKPLLSFFPMERPRETQVQALHYIERAINMGYKDIVISAPTGSGKGAIGATLCYWGASIAPQTTESGKLAQKGGYYLVTQKLLQDQLEEDLGRYKIGHSCSLKSSSEYPCRKFKSCGVGMALKCPHMHNCPYIIRRTAFEHAELSITNYAYFLTEQSYVGQLLPRNVQTFDECHSIERNLLKFAEVVVSDKTLKEWGVPMIRHAPEIDDMQEFAVWLNDVYAPVIRERVADLTSYLEVTNNPDEKMIRQHTALSSHLGKIDMAIEGITHRPDNWVYWRELDRHESPACNAKPLDARDYSGLLFGGGVIRPYLSAYPGEKKIFCKSLGLDPGLVAWKNLKSAFPKQNRPIYMGLIGSMSKKNIDSTLPVVLRVLDKIMSKHAGQKGVVHCVSYKLGEIVYNHFKKTAHGPRLLFPRNADERDEKFDEHRTGSSATVIISPSMGEGFNFIDELARWQAIIKLPWPYLGDKQVLAKKDMDQDWYDLQTIMALIQACGRIVRSETDTGITYLLDSDFTLLWDRHEGTFPDWYKEAMVWE